MGPGPSAPVAWWLLQTSVVTHSAGSWPLIVPCRLWQRYFRMPTMSSYVAPGGTLCKNTAVWFCSAVSRCVAFSIMIGHDLELAVEHCPGCRFIRLWWFCPVCAGLCISVAPILFDLLVPPAGFWTLAILVPSNFRLFLFLLVLLWYLTASLVTCHWTPCEVFVPVVQLQILCPLAILSSLFLISTSNSALPDLMALMSVPVLSWMPLILPGL